MDNTINTSQCCKECKYGSLLDENPKNPLVFCSIKNKPYTYGTRVPCDLKEKK